MYLVPGGNRCWDQHSMLHTLTPMPVTPQDPGKVPFVFLNLESKITNATDPCITCVHLVGLIKALKLSHGYWYHKLKHLPYLS